MNFKDYIFFILKAFSIIQRAYDQERLGIFRNSLKCRLALPVCLLCVSQFTDHFHKKPYFLAKACSSTVLDFYLTGIKNTHPLGQQ